MLGGRGCISELVLGLTGPACLSLPAPSFEVEPEPAGAAVPQLPALPRCDACLLQLPPPPPPPPAVLQVCSVAHPPTQPSSQPLSTSMEKIKEMVTGERVPCSHPELWCAMPGCLPDRKIRFTMLPSRSTPPSSC